MTPLRLIAAGAVAVTLAAALGGCQSQPGRFSRLGAKAEAAAWVHQVSAAIQPVSTSLRVNASIPCASDHSYFPTSQSWRNLTTVVPKGNPEDALALIEQAFEGAGWKSTGAHASVSGRELVLTSPLVHGGHGTVIVESATGNRELTVSAVSACYDG